MTRVDKPWGYEIIWAKTDKYVGKILYIQNGHQLSLQYHNIKDETIYVHSGILTFIYDGQEMVLPEGSSFHIETGKVHRMIAKDGDCLLFEVSTPELDDVVRLQDSYGRSK